MSEADDHAHTHSIRKHLASTNNSEGLTAVLLASKTGVVPSEIDRLTAANADFKTFTGRDTAGWEVKVYKLTFQGRKRYEAEERKKEAERRNGRDDGAVQLRSATEGGGLVVGGKRAGQFRGPADHKSNNKLNKADQNKQSENMSNPLFINKHPQRSKANPNPTPHQQPTSHPPPLNPIPTTSYASYAHPRANSPTGLQAPTRDYVGATLDPRPHTSTSQARQTIPTQSPSPIIPHHPAMPTSVTQPQPLTAQQSAAVQAELDAMLREFTWVVDLHRLEDDPEAIPALNHLEEHQGRAVRQAWEKVQKDKSDSNKRQLEQHYSSLSAKSVAIISALLANQLDTVVERKVDAFSDNLKTLVGNLQGLVDHHRQTLQPYNYLAASASARGASPATATANANPTGFADRDALNAAVSSLASELQLAIDAIKETRYRNRALVDSSVTAKIEALVEARVHERVAVREAEIEQRVRESLLREVREERAANEAAWESKLDARLEEFSKQSRGEPARAAVSAPVPAPNQVVPPESRAPLEVDLAAVRGQVEQTVHSFLPGLLHRIAVLENPIAPLGANPAPAPAAAPVAATPAATPAPSASVSSGAQEEDVKPRIHELTGQVAEALQRRVRDLERRLGFAALDAREDAANRPEEDRVLPRGRTVCDVLDESQLILGDIVGTVNKELEALENRIMALEQGGVQGFAALGGPGEGASAVEEGEVVEAEVDLGYY